MSFFSSVAYSYELKKLKQYGQTAPAAKMNGIQAKVTVWGMKSVSTRKMPQRPPCKYPPINQKLLSSSFR